MKKVTECCPEAFRVPDSVGWQRCVDADKRVPVLTLLSLSISYRTRSPNVCVCVRGRIFCCCSFSILPHHAIVWDSLKNEGSSSWQICAMTSSSAMRLCCVWSWKNIHNRKRPENLWPALLELELKWEIKHLPRFVFRVCVCVFEREREKQEWIKLMMHRQREVRDWSMIFGMVWSCHRLCATGHTNTLTETRVI